MSKPAWQRYPDAHAPVYDGNVFARNTEREVEFLLDVLRLPRAGAPRKPAPGRRPTAG